jgi:hypothetical protein
MRTTNGMNRSVATAAVLTATLVAGCASRSISTDWAGSIRDMIGSKGEVAYFAGVADLPVRDGPKLSAKLVGHLTLHQRILRSTVTNGYARVRVPEGSLHGWVVSAKLLRTLPADDTSSVK